MNNNNNDVQWILRSKSGKPDFIKAALIKNLALEQYDLKPNTKAYLFPTSSYLVNNGDFDQILNITLFIYKLGIPYRDVEKRISLWTKLRREIYRKANENLIKKDLYAFVKTDLEIEDLIKKECNVYRQYKKYGNLKNVYLVTISDSEFETNIAGRKCQIEKGTSIYKLDILSKDM